MRPSPKQFYVYIMANRTNVAIYTGVTSSLQRRIWEHKEKLIPGFAERYDICKLVYYEILADAESAILREKRLKGSSRARKNRLVNGMNPEWRDLCDEL